jgi:hypothetical protein
MKTAEQMHAIVCRKYGTPDVLAYEVIERPVPGDEVLLSFRDAGWLDDAWAPRQVLATKYRD